MSGAPLRIGCYNLLAPCYATKHKQLEGLSHGADNWQARWPAIARALAACPWDIVCVTELGRSSDSTCIRDLGALCSALARPLTMLDFNHSRRKDAVAVLYAEDRFEQVETRTLEFNGAVAPLVDLRERTTGAVLRVMAIHQWHPVDSRHVGHMRAILDFAARGRAVDYTVLAGDFNEDARKSRSPEQAELVQRYRTADRRDCPRLPVSSTSKGNATSSGPVENKLDWIWVQGAEPKYDDMSQHVIASSHRTCPETGMWPSDHGMEAVCCELLKHRHYLGFALPDCDGEAILFKGESGSDGGVGHWILKRLVALLPDETVARVPAEQLHAVLVPPTWLASLPVAALAGAFPRAPPGGPWRCRWTGYAIQGSAGHAGSELVATFEVEEELQAISAAYLQGFRDACAQAGDATLQVPLARTSATCEALRDAFAQLGSASLPRANADGCQGFSITEVQLL